MRMSRQFSQTLRDVPSEAEVASHQLLLRAGYIRQLAAGVFSYLPLGLRALNRLEQIIREEMDAIGGQELTMPVVHPAELWQESGRWYKIDAEMGRFVDRGGRNMVLGMTHEEVAADLARKEIHSYRQLPQVIYQIQTKWRDDPRPRAGLIRGREFIMKDSYTLDATWEGLEEQYQRHYQAYFNIFSRAGLDVIAVGADTGMMGGKLAHEFMYLTPIGEDTLILCDACGYADNRQVARFARPQPEVEVLHEIEKVATPDCKTIADLAQFLGIRESQTAKAVFMMAEILEGKQVRPQFVFAVVRGDMELNETKLAQAVRARSLRPATEDEIRAVGAEPGYASPVGLRIPNNNAALVVVDELVTTSPNLVAGANESGYHLRNVNYGRDFSAQIVTDLVAARAGDPCPDCGAPMRAVRGIEVGNIFQLGDDFSRSLGAYYTDAHGAEQPVIMGSYGIGITRLLACVAEEYHDQYGLVWPVSVAPYPVHLIRLVGRSASEAGDSTTERAEQLYESLRAAGLEPLYDDTNDSPGEKFNIADLIGLPVRLTVSERAMKARGVEMKRRDRAEKEIVPFDAVIERVREVLAELEAGIAAKVAAVQAAGAANASRASEKSNSM